MHMRMYILYMRASRRTASGSASCSASLCRAPRTEAKPAAMAWLW